MYKILYVLLAMLLPGMAFAGPFTPVSDDISVKVINQIFGGLVNGGNDAFAGAISTFNGAVLIVGGILATYTLLAGTLGTAHDGEMLGKKFSSVWIPIRYTLGTALVLPVVGNGYCIMQQLVMWLILQGIGLADVVWDSYMQTPGVAANLSVNKNTQDKIKALAENIFMAQVCVKSNAYSVQHSDSILTIASRYNYSMVYDSTKRVYNFGDQKGLTSGWTTNDCGEVNFGELIPNSTVAAGPSTANTGYLGPLDNLFAATDIQPINKAHETATAALVASMGSAADALMGKDSLDAAGAADIYKQIDTASKTDLDSIKSAATSVAMSPSDTTKTAHQYGWFMAGAYFMNTVVTNNKITNALAGVPDSKFAKSAFNDDAEATQALGLKVLASGNPDYGSAANAINQKQGIESSRETEELGWSGRIVNAITRGFTSIDLYQLKNDTRHPVIVINEMGNRLQALWTGLVVTLLGVSAAAGIAALLKSSIATTVSNMLLVIIGFLGLPIAALAATSFTASYLIPMLPFMMWLGILGGWLIAVVIAILAAPLWAVMHLHPNGDDLTGRGGNGYMMVLSLLLRPALAIFGFIAAITISSVMGEFINKVFFQVFSFSQGDGKGLGFFIGIIAGTAIYVAIMFSFVKKTFGLMHVVPDELMRWIGGGGDQLGHYAGKMGEGSTGTVGAIAAFTAGRGLSQNLQNTGRQLNDLGKAHSATAKNKENEGKNKNMQRLKNQKDFNDFKENLDSKFGLGTGERIASAMGITADNVDSFDSQEKMYSVGSAMKSLEPYGSEAQDKFVGALENASFSGFSSHGGSAKNASNELSQGVVSGEILSQAQAQFGSNGQQYLATVAGDGNGGIDNAKAQRALSDLGKAQKALGANFNSVFNEAVSNHGSNAAAMTASIASAYTAAKSGGDVGGTGGTVPTAESIPDAQFEIPMFNPATNEVDYPPGTNRSEQPVQIEMDLTPTEPPTQQEEIIKSEKIQQGENRI